MKFNSVTQFFYLVVKASLSMAYKSIRENFTHQCAVILSCYRKHCSSQSPAGQLILPESLKLLPMYANCLLKSDALLSRKWTKLFSDSNVDGLFRSQNILKWKFVNYVTLSGKDMGDLF